MLVDQLIFFSPKEAIELYYFTPTIDHEDSLQAGIDNRSIAQKQAFTDLYGLGHDRFAWQRP